LAAPLHLGVVALYGGEVEILDPGAGSHRGGRDTAETDQHGRTTEHDQTSTDRNVALFDVLWTNVAVAARDHDRLVVATDFDGVGIIQRRLGRLQLEGTEITAEVGTTVFVVEGSPTERTVEHD